MMTTARIPAISLALFGLIYSAAGFSAVSRALETEDTTQAGQDSKLEVASRDVTEGSLRIVGQEGEIVQCPLKHTDVQAEVSGFIARVNVTQTFENPTEDTIEAVYVFPLPHEAAVDDMTMVIGDRKIVGVIKRRDEARRIYQQALSQGQTAALLEQERPNIFTQSVGNIAPGQKVEIRISYVDVLKYDMGQYEFHFPMVVGPRFIPGAPIDSPEPTPPSQQGKVSPPVANTDRVPDAQRISPPVLKPDARNGHDISLAVTLDAGVPVQNLDVANHRADVQTSGESKATIKLTPSDSIPNKDFVLRYGVVGERPEMAVLAHTGKYSPDAAKLGTGYFMLMIQPQENQQLKKTPSREIVFLVDVSGSMRGAKTDKVREAMQQMLGLCRQHDTVQVVTFANQADKLFERPVPVNQENIQRALNFSDSLRGSGGTHMLQGVKMAIDEPIDKQRLRVIVMLSDGFIGNESEIIEHVGRECGDRIRFWTVGIGQSPNMFLVEGVARQGGGMGKRLGLNDEAEALAQEVMTRIQRAQLADVKIDWGEMQVSETYPTRIPELWTGRPIVLFGRFRDGGRNRIEISGTVEGDPVKWSLDVELPKEQAEHDALASVWARRRIEDLMQQTYYVGSPAVEETVTALALDYRLMSPYTSFVAVDQKEANESSPAARPPRRMTVPVPLPEGSEWEGYFGGESEEALDGLLGFELKKSVTHESLSLFSTAPAPRAGGVIGGGARGIANGAVPVQLMYRFEAPARGGRLAAANPSFRRRAVTATRGLSSSFGRGFGGVELTRGRALSVLNVEAKSVDALGAYMVPALRQSAAELSQLARKSAESARIVEDGAPEDDSEKTGEADEETRRAALLRACFLDHAAASFHASNGQLGDQAAKVLEKLREQVVDQWVSQSPKLGEKLNLVVRDRSIADALRDVAETSGVDITLIDGSLADVEHLSSMEGRIGYLDLRGATVAEALDWILVPARLTWQWQEGRVIAASQRRLPGESAWIYDVAWIATPTQDELGGENQDNQKKVEQLRKLTDEFLRVTLAELKLSENEQLVWYAPGRLLLIGDHQRHQAAAKLLNDLQGANELQLEGEAAQLRARTVDRFTHRREQRSKAETLSHKLRIARIHQAYGRKLLAAAAGGQADEEAITWLSIAWNDAATDSLFDAETRAVPLRSLWMIIEASRALPHRAELAELARAARRKTEPFAASVLEVTTTQQEGVAPIVSLLYCALALRDDADLVRKSLPHFAQAEADNEQIRQLKLLARCLLDESSRIDADALSSLLNRGVQGEDLVMLAGLACRRAGGETWDDFRARSNDLLGRQPLPGEVVVLLHHLGEDRLPIAR